MSVQSLSPVTLTPTSQASPSARLRAIVEIVGGELKIYPIGESDAECNEILQALLLEGRERQ